MVNELRIGYAKTNPYTSSRTTATRPRRRSASRASTSTRFTTGLPNINITNFTGISGGPAFLPVNPKQFHYQMEDALVWLKGGTQVKFGYRFVDRWPSPFTNNTRSLINFGTSFVNNPLTNTGGTGLAAVLLGYFNSAVPRLPARVLHVRTS